MRAAVLAAWRDSPTRLREDSATEADLVVAGYRDRLLTELAQNAADAAAEAGVPGRLWVRVEGRVLRIANTGVPLGLAGVHALTALRASDKSEEVVGRFGVGFTAVLSVSEDIEIRSTTGSLRFSRERTREALREWGIGDPADGSAPPVLRLAWPVSDEPAAGADTEVILRLRAEVDVEALVKSMRAEAADLLVELPALREIRIAEDEITSATTVLDSGLTELRITGPGALTRVWWQYSTARTRWLVPVRAGRPVAAEPDVLRAPTRSDEELSLPALLIADIPMQPDRRRLLPGSVLSELVRGYADFARALPRPDRLILVPAPGFARGEVDAQLREAVLTELRTHPWLPVRPTPDTDESARPTTAFGVPVPDPVAVPTRASVVTGLTADLAELLDDVVAPLVIPELSGPAWAEALTVLDVHRLGLARIAELTAGSPRSPRWWHALYEALEAFAADPLAAEELGALAVPLTDDRVVTGPRTVVLGDGLDPTVTVPWARVVHPEAAHPLLARLGARTATPEDLLADPVLRAELEERADDPEITEAVLRLAAAVAGRPLPPWLGMVELPDSEGEYRPADELLLPDAPLYPLLVSDAPLGTVDPDLVAEYGAEALRALGVGWDFGVVVEDDPTGPDHQLDDEESWWDGLVQDPPRLVAVRDLDLVDEVAWPDALLQLVSEPRTRRVLADPDGYTAWWLRRHARVRGTRLGLYRHPADAEFAGLLPEFGFSGFGGPELDGLRSVFVNPAVVTVDLAEALLDALADEAHTPSAEVVARTHALLARAVAEGRLDPVDLELPHRVRAVSGAPVDAAAALVLDQPWFGFVVSPRRLVFGDVDNARALARLLDLPPVSQAVTAEVLGEGRRTTWAAEPLGTVLPLVFALPSTGGELVVHEQVRVRLSGAVTGTVTVPWWRDGAVTHVAAPPPAQDA
ncbi:sacsin N-terminal ATP-binding-like domain-containing protein [Nocardia takedensis]